MLITKTTAVNNSIKGQNIPQNYSTKFLDIKKEREMTINDIQSLFLNSKLLCFYEKKQCNSLDRAFLGNYILEKLDFKTWDLFFNIYIEYIQNQKYWKFILEINTDTVARELGLYQQNALSKNDEIQIIDFVKDRIKKKYDHLMITVDLI